MQPCPIVVDAVTLDVRHAVARMAEKIVASARSVFRERQQRAPVARVEHVTSLE